MHTWHDSSTRVTCLIHMCSITHPHVWCEQCSFYAWLFKCVNASCYVCARHGTQWYIILCRCATRLLQRGAVWCSVAQCGAVWCIGSVIRCMFGSVLQCVAVCCSLLQCVAVCCSVLQCGSTRDWKCHIVAHYHIWILTLTYTDSKFDMYEFSIWRIWFSIWHVWILNLTNEHMNVQCSSGKRFNSDIWTYECSVWFQMTSEHLYVQYDICYIVLNMTYDCVMSRRWIAHSTLIHAACHTQSMGRKSKGKSWNVKTEVAQINESCHAYEWVMSHVRMSRVTHMNESCHAQLMGKRSKKKSRRCLCRCTKMCGTPVLTTSFQVCCSVLQHVAVRWSVWGRLAHVLRRRIFKCVAVRCSALRCVAVHCSALQFLALYDYFWHTSCIYICLFFDMCMVCIDISVRTYPHFAYVYRYWYTHTTTYLHMYTDVSIYMHTYMHTHTHSHTPCIMYTHVSIYIHTYMHTHTHAHTSCIYMYIHAYMHTCIHTHSHTSPHIPGSHLRTVSYLYVPTCKHTHMYAQLMSSRSHTATWTNSTREIRKQSKNWPGKKKIAVPNLGDAGDLF